MIDRSKRCSSSNVLTFLPLNRRESVKFLMTANRQMRITLSIIWENTLQNVIIHQQLKWYFWRVTSKTCLTKFAIYPWLAHWLIEKKKKKLREKEKEKERKKRTSSVCWCLTCTVPSSCLFKDSKKPILPWLSPIVFVISSI